MKKCDFCDAENNDTALSCKECGADITGFDPNMYYAHDPAKVEPHYKKKWLIAIIIFLLISLILYIPSLINTLNELSESESTSTSVTSSTTVVG